MKTTETTRPRKDIRPVPRVRGITYRFAAMATVGLAAIWAAGCGSATAPENAPAGHTEVHGGAAHMPGLKSPTEKCVSCHGATLQGGANGEPSCFSCHGKKR